MADFVAYWRSRGFTLRQGYYLWRYASAGTGLAKARITEGTFRWVRAL